MRTIHAHRKSASFLRTKGAPHQAQTGHADNVT